LIIFYFYYTVVPSEGPIIDGSEPAYEINNLINLTCAANPSTPAQALTWYINNQKVVKCNAINFSLN